MDDVIAELMDRQDALKETRDTIRRKVEAQDVREEAALNSLVPARFFTLAI